MSHRRKIIYAEQDYTVGTGRIADGSNLVDYQIILPPWVQNANNDYLGKLARISIVQNSEAGAADPAYPSANPLASLRSYFIPYTKRVCEIHEGLPATAGLWGELLRTTPRIPLVGWYSGETGQREVNDTNFGEGHEVPRMTGGNYWALLMASEMPSGLLQSFAVTLHWVKEVLADGERWEA
jgi:hypothetical protein